VLLTANILVSMVATYPVVLQWAVPYHQLPFMSVVSVHGLITGAVHCDVSVDDVSPVADGEPEPYEYAGEPATAAVQTKLLHSYYTSFAT
jgi:hypothetical protein